MKFFEKLNEVFFGNVSGKVSFLTKLIMIINVVVGIVLFVTGIVKYHFFTYLSYGLGMADTSVKMGATYMLMGLCFAVGGWLVGLLILGFNKIIKNAELEEELEKEYWENFECAECEARDGSCVETTNEPAKVEAKPVKPEAKPAKAETKPEDKPAKPEK